MRAIVDIATTVLLLLAAVALVATIVEMFKNWRGKRAAMRWLLPIGFGIVGLVIWALASDPLSDPKDWSDLGSTMAGGAIIAAAILFVERSFATEAERRAAQFGIESLGKLPGIGLNGRDLTHSYWINKDITDSDLSDAKLDNSYIRDCTFGSGTFLLGTSFKNARLPGTRFAQGTNIAGASFKHADLTRVVFRGVLTGHPTEDGERVSPVTGRDYGANVDFTGANLYETDFRFADLSHAIGLELARNKGKTHHDNTTKWPGQRLPAGF